MLSKAPLWRDRMSEHGMPVYRAWGVHGGCAWYLAFATRKSFSEVQPGGKYGLFLLKAARRRHAVMHAYSNRRRAKGAPTEQAASGPQAATRCSRSAPVSKLSGCRAKTLELILLPLPAASSREHLVQARTEAPYTCMAFGSLRREHPPS